MAVDTLGNLLAVHITPANEQEGAQVAELARQVQQATGQTVKLAFADQGYMGEATAQAARDEGIDCRSSGCPRRRRASYCCSAAGWSSAASAGSTGSGDWREITSACPKLSQACSSVSSPLCTCCTDYPKCLYVSNTDYGQAVLAVAHPVCGGANFAGDLHHGIRVSQGTRCSASV